jgi:hypothetical protein
MKSHDALTDLRCADFVEQHETRRLDEPNEWCMSPIPTQQQARPDGCHQLGQEASERRAENALQHRMCRRHHRDCASTNTRTSIGSRSEIRQIKVWRKVMTMVTPTDVIPICFAQERLSPDCIACSSERKERAGSNGPESHCLSIHERLDDAQDTMLSLVSRFDLCRESGDARYAVYSWVYLPVRGDTDPNGGRRPPATKGGAESEEDEQEEEGLGGTSGGDGEDKGVEEMGGCQEGCDLVSGCMFGFSRLHSWRMCRAV